MLERAMRSYTNQSLDAAQAIAEFVELAKQIRAERDRGAKLGLRDDELEFYDAVCQNDSAVLEFGDNTSQKDRARISCHRAAQRDRGLGQEGASTGIVLRHHIRRLLTKYKYPPDK
jgi:type I restriction enzyme R subunit